MCVCVCLICSQICRYGSEKHPVMQHASIDVDVGAALHYGSFKLYGCTGPWLCEAKRDDQYGREHEHLPVDVRTV